MSFGFAARRGEALRIAACARRTPALFHGLQGDFDTFKQEFSQSAAANAGEVKPRSWQTADRGRYSSGSFDP